MYNVIYIPSDGIGPEIVDAAKRIVERAGTEIEWVRAEAGQCAIKEYGNPVPEETLSLIRTADATLKGPFTNLPTGFPSPNQTLRSKLNLFANLRLAKTFEGTETPFKNVDLVVVRECTEDLYAGVEQMVGADAAVAIKPTTRRACENIVRFAFDYAVRNARKKVTVALKASILKLTDGLFLRVARELSKSYPHVEFQEANIDAQRGTARMPC